MPRQLVAPRLAPQDGIGGLTSGISVWLLILFAIGAWIVIGDGLTLPYVADGTALTPQPMEYEPYTIAWVFAGIAFPLVFLHGASLRLKWTESLLLWFVLCTIAYTKDFAYLKVPGIPFYVTDVTLAILLTSLFLWPRLRLPRLSSVPMALLVLFFMAGTLALVRGVAGGQGILAFRDYAMVAYALFALVALHLGRARLNAAQMFVMLLMGHLLTTLRSMAWYLAQPGMRRYVGYGTYIPIAVAWMAFCLITKRVKLAIGGPVLFVLGVEVILANGRTVDVTLAAAVVVLALTGSLRIHFREVVKPLLGTLAVLVLSTVMLLQTKAGSDYLERNVGEFVSGVVQTQQDDNATFRFLAWAEALRRFADNPLFGEGYGVPFFFELSPDVDMQTHNTFLTVLYKAGLVGLLPLATLIGYSVVTAWRTVLHYPGHADVDVLRGLLLSQVLLCVNGMVNPLLEIPFLGSLFWLNFGLMVRLTRTVRADARPATA